MPTLTNADVKRGLPINIIGLRAPLKKSNSWRQKSGIVFRHFLPDCQLFGRLHKDWIGVTNHILNILQAPDNPRFYRIEQCAHECMKHLIEENTFQLLAARCVCSALSTEN
jgi:hypothetical protein